MNWQSAVAVQDSDANKPAVNVFATPQSLVTFSGATGAALAMTTVIKSLIPGWDVTWIGVSTAFFIEAVIYVIGFDAKLSKSQQIAGIAIAFINTFVIIAAVLGIQIGGVQPETNGS